MVRIKFLVDTNPLVDWVLLKGKKGKKIPIKFKSSVEFIDKLMKNKTNKFYTTPYNLTELPNAISKQFVMFKMFWEGISFNYYQSVNKELRKQHMKEFEKLYEEILDKLILNNKIGLKDIDLSINKIKEINEIQIILGLDLYDAIIFKIFIDEKIDYFITRDTDFLKNPLLKKFCKGKTWKIVNPENAKKLI